MTSRNLGKFWPPPSSRYLEIRLFNNRRKIIDTLPLRLWRLLWITPMQNRKFPGQWRLLTKTWTEVYQAPMAGPFAAIIIGLGNSMKVLKTAALCFTIIPCSFFGYMGFRVLLKLTPKEEIGKLIKFENWGVTEPLFFLLQKLVLYCIKHKCAFDS